MTNTKKKKSIRTEIRDWAIFFSIITLLYIAGVPTLLQKAVLFMGIVKPNTSIPKEQQKTVDYNFDLVTLDGKRMNFSELKGKTVFMNIWATWCGPCVAEMPDIYSLYQSIKDENVVFVMLSVDENKDAVSKFLKKKQFKFPVYFLESNLPSVFDHNSIPRTYVVSPQGKVAAQKIGMAHYNSASFKEFLRTL